MEFLCNLLIWNTKYQSCGAGKFSFFVCSQSSPCLNFVNFIKIMRVSISKQIDLSINKDIKSQEHAHWFLVSFGQCVGAHWVYEALIWVQQMSV